MIKRLIRLLAWTSGLLLLTGGSLLLYVQSSSDALTSRFLGAVNDNLSAKASVDNLAIDLFGQFPDISLRLDDFYIADPTDEKGLDTLMYFSSVYAQFKLLPALRGKTILQRITAKGGKVYLHWDSNGDGNFNILADKGSKSAQIDLKGLTVLNSQVHLLSDGEQPWSTQFLAHRMRLKGKTDSNLIEAVADWELDMPSWNDEHMIIRGSMDMLGDGQVTVMQSGRLEVNQWAMDLTGQMDESGSQWSMQAKALDIEEILHLMPSSLVPDPDMAQIDGLMDLTVDITSTDQGLDIHADGEWTQGKLNVSNGWLDANNITASVHFDNGRFNSLTSSTLSMTAFTGKSRGSVLGGSFRLDNLNQPNLAATLDFNSPWMDWMHWLKLTTWDGSSGQVNGSVGFKRSFTSMEAISSEGLWPAIWSGGLQITDGHFAIEGAKQPLIVHSATVELHGQDVHLINASVQTGSTVAKAEGIIHQALAASGPMTHDLTLTGKRWVIEDLIGSEIWNANLTGEPDDGIPWADHHRVHMNCQSMLYDGIQATDVSANLVGTGLNVKIDKLRLSHAGGLLSGNAFFMPLDEGHHSLSFQGLLSHVNLEKFMDEWQDFGQDQITHENLSGMLSAQVSLQFEWDDNWDLLSDQFTASADFSVANGRLQNYSPLLDLARFADVTNLVDVRFGTLENQLRIANEIITIPQMTLENNALVLKVEGSHSFDNVMDFTLRMNLRDLSGIGNSDGSKNLRNYIAVQDDRGPVWIPMKLYGSVDDLQCKLDSKSLKEDIGQSIKDDWNSQGDEIKSALQGKGKEAPSSEESKYEYEWSEEPDSNRTFIESHRSFNQAAFSRNEGV
ncbi:MAG: hypothetical protein GWO75_01735 [Bacteroidetes bacterium]|nr:hypothetical protein [Bacteroidota bacterium]